MEFKYFWRFVVCCFLFWIYNELTLPFFGSRVPDLLNILWLLGSALLVSFGALFGVCWIESLDKEGAEPWFYKYLKRLVRE